jgi:hypothetical protein
MFIVARRGFRLRSPFFFWAFVCLLIGLGLTMHVHYDPEGRQH